MPNHDSKIPAGPFSLWLHKLRQAQVNASQGSNVPCGECNGCCRSALFITIRADEASSLSRIPKSLLFPAPGLPKGYRVMGFNEKGECPMLVENRCSIYNARPQTCRDFDCRVFAATGLDLGDSARDAISKQVRRWEFAFPESIDREESLALQDAASFLVKHKDLFPNGIIPRQPAQIAVLAIRIYPVFQALRAAPNVDPLPAAVIVKTILNSLKEGEGGDVSIHSKVQEMEEIN